jgi:hypothetical protein
VGEEEEDDDEGDAADGDPLNISCASNRRLDRGEGRGGRRPLPLLVLLLPVVALVPLGVDGFTLAPKEKEENACSD